MNFMKSRIDRPVDPLPRPQVFRHIQPRPAGTSRSGSKSIHDTLNETVAANEPYVVCALAEGRGHAALEIGLAAIDVSAAPVLQMSQFSDNFWYSNVLTSLQALNPSVIFFSDHSLNTRSSNLPTIIQQFLVDVQIVSLPRSFFNDCNAEKYMDDLCSSSYQTLKQTVHCKYYGLAAVGAILRHCCEAGLLRIAAKSLQFKYVNKKDTMAIDVECVGHLEVIFSLQNMADKQSLYQFVNHCITAVGKRHLRANLLEPSSKQGVLEARLACIGELLVNSELLGGIQGILRGLVDIGALMKLSVDVDSTKSSKQNTLHVLNQASTLRNALRSVPELEELLGQAEAPFLRAIRHVLATEVYKRLYDQICTVLDADGANPQTASYYRLFLIKSGVSSTLDVFRRLYSEVIDEIREHIADLTRELRLLLKMSFNKTTGFHIQLNVKEGTTVLPPVLKVLSRAGKRYSLTTSTLQALNERIEGIIREIESVSYGIIKQLIDTIREDIESVYLLVAHITDLDMVQSLAVVSQDKDYCRPSFARCTKIVGARHPLLESYGAVDKVVRSNVIATPEYNVFLVTGPNMSGKTVYIKTICLLQIMAQLGCYVPAAKAEFRIADRLMAIFGAAESVEQDLSNSSRMAKKLEVIAHSLSVDSLVVIDELFGDTQHPETDSPRWKLLEQIAGFIGFDPSAKCESLSAIRRPFIYLTTHCHDMLRPLEHMHNVSRLCLQTETVTIEGSDRLRYKYTVSEGKTSVKNYGISLARCVRMPPSVITRAEQINEQLKARSSTTQVNAHNSTLADETLSTQANLRCFDKRLYDLYAQIACVLSAPTDGQDSDTLTTHLNSVLEGFTSALPPEAVRYLRQTPLDELLRKGSAADRTTTTVVEPSVSDFAVAESDDEEPRDVESVEHIEIDETIDEEQLSEDL
uniref:MutS protein homolog 4 n=2 Tax=Culex pipiens TaxID=7175 RepID=A0A8D8E0A8_CULPI